MAANVVTSPAYTCRRGIVPNAVWRIVWMYETASGRVRRLELPSTADFHLWLDRDTLLVELLGDEHLMKYAVSTGKMTTTKVPAGYHQLALRPDTDSVIGWTSPVDLVEVSIQSGDSTLIASGGQGRFIAGPRPSPSGKRLAYLDYDGSRQDGLKKLVVDGTVITESSDVSRFAWLNDSSLVIDFNTNPRVINATTGKLLYRPAD